jgi:hypothetical protein
MTTGPNFKLTSLDLSYNKISSLSRNLQLFNFHAVKFIGEEKLKCILDPVRSRNLVAFV